MGREEALRRQLLDAQEGIAQRDAFLRQLQEEAALSASALKQAARVSSGIRSRQRLRQRDWFGLQGLQDSRL